MQNNLSCCEILKPAVTLSLTSHVNFSDDDDDDNPIKIAIHFPRIFPPFEKLSLKSKQKGV